MKLQRVLSITRRAVDDYRMIREGDVIAVGVSGGKDSMTMLTALAEMRRFYPAHYEIRPILVDLGFRDAASPEERLKPIQDYCEDLGAPLTVVSSDIAQVIFDVRNESNPCSLCAKMRKGALNTRAKELGCNKIAYAHHKDDFIETMVLSLLYEGRFYCFSPVTWLDRMELTVIRPMMYMEEADVIGFRNLTGLPVIQNPCPADGNTRREYAKKLIASLNAENPGCRDRFFRAVLEGQIPGWPPKGVQE